MTSRAAIESAAAEFLAELNALSASLDAPAQSDEDIVLDATHRAQAADWAGMPSCSDVRALCALDKASFDKAAMGLAKARRVHLYHHDAAEFLSAAERAKLVTDGRVHYNCMRIA